MIVQHPIEYHDSTKVSEELTSKCLQAACTFCLLFPCALLGEIRVMGACLAGSIGKTTTSWLIRGIFEEWGKLTGMAGTIENAIYADKLDAEGNLWTPDEPDPTLDRQVPSTAA